MTYTPNSEQRLDRIERILDTLASNQITEREDRLAVREDLEILSQTVQRSVENTDRAISQLTQNLNSSIQDLTGIMVQFAHDAEADRAVMREIQTEVRGLQSENRRILDHLFGQQPL